MYNDLRNRIDTMSNYIVLINYGKHIRYAGEFIITLSGMFFYCIKLPFRLFDIIIIQPIVEFNMIWINALRKIWWYVALFFTVGICFQHVCLMKEDKTHIWIMARVNDIVEYSCINNKVCCISDSYNRLMETALSKHAYNICSWCSDLLIVLVVYLIN